MAPRLTGGAHRRPHGAHQLAQQGANEGGFARGPRAENGDHHIAPLQFLPHAFPFLAEGLTLHRVAHLLQGLINGLEIAGRGLPAAAGRLHRLPLPLRAGAPQGLKPGPTQLGHGQSDRRHHDQQQGTHQPFRQPVTQLPEQLVEALQHHAHQEQHHQGDGDPEPEAQARHQGPGG